MAIYKIENALKAQQWEKAKGEMRAMVALQGAYITTDCKPGVVQDETVRWEQLRDATEAYIQFIEGHGLQE